MSSEIVFEYALWVLIGLMVLMRVGFSINVWRAGERLMPDHEAIEREGRWVVALRAAGFALLVALVALALRHRLGLLSIPLPTWLRWAGVALGFASLGLWTWTHAVLGRFWSAQLQLRGSHQLVTEGPYSRVRHPMYTAILAWIVSLGLVAANGAPLLFAVLFAAFVAARVSREERMMLDRFGNEYRDYMGRTGRFLPV